MQPTNSYCPYLTPHDIMKMAKDLKILFFGNVLVLSTRDTSLHRSNEKHDHHFVVAAHLYVFDLGGVQCLCCDDCA